MYTRQNSFTTSLRIILLTLVIALIGHTVNAQKAPAEASKLLLHAQAVINASVIPTILASVDVTAYREIRVSASGPVDKGILIGIYQVEGETAILLDTILLEHTSLSPDPQVPDLLFGTTNRGTKVIDFPGRNLRITGVAINLLNLTVSGATVDLIIYGR